jgi:hypothetical protein
MPRSRNNSRRRSKFGMQSSSPKIGKFILKRTKTGLVAFDPARLERKLEDLETKLEFIMSSQKLTSSQLQRQLIIMQQMIEVLLKRIDKSDL